MNHQPPGATVRPGSEDRVIVVGAGPVGCTASLLLADYGMPVTLLERHTRPDPLPRAVHLDDEVARTLARIGVSDGFLSRSRSCSGLRLLDAEHKVMAEFRREHAVGVHGFPQANMFHQPDLEQLMLARVAQHPLIDFRRGVEVCGLDDGSGAAPVQVFARFAPDQTAQPLTGRFVLGCDGANSTIRHLLGIAMDDLGFTERWLVVDIRSDTPLNTWEGVEQVCDPARAATFMQVAGDRYRWEFQLRDSEHEASLTSPQALGRLLQPWTGRSDTDGLDIIRTATYTFRARLASRFQSGRVFLLGDAAHLTPPFIGQGLGAGLRDADNLAWKIAFVLTGQADQELLASYDTERRPHARAMIQKAVRIGWAMTGGQDRAAAIRRIVLAAAVRSGRVRDTIASTQTPRLKAGALRPAGRVLPGRNHARTGSLIPNPLVSVADGASVRLDTVLAGRAAVLTVGHLSSGLIDLCRRHRLLLIEVGACHAVGQAAEPGRSQTDGDAVVVHPVAGHAAAALQTLIGGPGSSVLVRPDRVIADAAPRSRLPRLPWSIQAAPVPEPAPQNAVNPAR
jgi:3-(3-hydroxy-phenyl)propionate hydroxylase